MEPADPPVPGDSVSAARRSRRRRSRSGAGVARRTENAATSHGAQPADARPATGSSSGSSTGAGPPGRTGPKSERSEAAEGGRGGRDRGLRDLIGAGPSQVGVSRALRARDLNRPSEDDLADAEQDIVLIRRNWKPKPS